MSVQAGNWSREQNFDSPSLNLDFVNGKGVDSRLKTTRVGTTTVCTEAGYVQTLNFDLAAILFQHLVYMPIQNLQQESV